MSLQGRPITEKIMKTAIGKSGYEMVNLRNGPLMKRIKVHRLVAQSFLSTTNGNNQVNHIDGNKANNNLENLELVSASDNQKHSARVLGNTPKGQMKLAERTARNNEIRLFLKSVNFNVSQTFLVNKFRIGFETAARLIDSR